MKKLIKLSYFKNKLVILSSIFFFLGCMVTINLYPIDRTCKLDTEDREYNIMNNEKLKNPDLIILILSAPKNLEKRNTIRETWLKFQVEQPEIKEENVKFKMKHYFVLGSFGLSADNILHLSGEQSQYNDMLILPIQDNYHNITYKILKSITWLSDQVDYGLGFKYILKCDDDSFVRLDKLGHELLNVELLYHKSQIDWNRLHEHNSPYMSVHAQVNSGFTYLSGHNYVGLYWGYFKGNAHIFRKGKWQETDWILCDHYLPYALGGGYILSRNLVQFIAANEDHWKLYNSEDVSVGTWLASKSNIIRIHDVRFDTEWKTRGCQNHYLITHSVSVSEMRTLYKNVQRTGQMCHPAKTYRMHYLYNWKASPSECCVAATSPILE